MKGPSILLALGIIVLAAAAGNFYLNQDSAAPPVTAQPTTTSPPAPAAARMQKKPLPDSLSYVPEDTILFAGGLETYTVSDMAAMMRGQESMMATLSDDDTKELFSDEDMPHAAKMLMAIMLEFNTNAKEPEKLAERIGLASEIDNAFYSIGMLPVYRLKISNIENFNTFVGSLEKKHAIQGVEKNYKGVSYRSYSFDAENTTKSSEISFIIAINDNYAIFSVEAPLEHERYLPLVLGIDKPEKPISDSSLLSDISTQHQLHPAYLGFFNHVDLVKAITNSSNSDFGKMFNYLVDKEMEQEKSDDFVLIRTPACQKELVDIAQNWPRTIMGYTDVSLDSLPIQMTSRLLFESSNKDTIEQLRSLRGFIPAVLSNSDTRALFGIALGLNVDALLPFIAKTTADLTATPYSCEPLKEMQMAVSENQQNPELAIASAMAAGIKGLSLSLLNIDIAANDTGGQPDVKSVDALITISADDPSGLLTKALSMAPPPFNTLQIPADGQAVDIPMPMPVPPELQPKIAIKGNHVVAYVGADGEKAANQLSKEPLTGNGVFAFGLDYEKSLSAITPTLTTIEKMDPDSAAALQAMSTFTGDLKMLFDMSEHGPVFDAKVTIH